MMAFERTTARPSSAVGMMLKDDESCWPPAIKTLPVESVTSGLFDDSRTVMPPVGAAADRCTLTPVTADPPSLIVAGIPVNDSVGSGALGLIVTFAVAW